jgi:hypothetical protein
MFETSTICRVHIDMSHGFPLQHGVKDGYAFLPLLLEFSVEYTTSKATINPGGMETD